MSHEHRVPRLYAPSADGSFQLVAGEQLVAAALSYLDTRIVRGQIFERPRFLARHKD